MSAPRDRKPNGPGRVFTETWSNRDEVKLTWGALRASAVAPAPHAILGVVPPVRNVPAVSRVPARPPIPRLLKGNATFGGGGHRVWRSRFEPGRPSNLHYLRATSLAFSSLDPNE